MKVVKAQALLSLYKNTAKRVEAIATELRSHGFLPKGGRGPYAPDADAAQVAYLALAVAGADKVAEAAQVAGQLAFTVNRNGLRLIQLMASCIADPVKAHEVRHIRVNAVQPMAEVTYRVDGRCEYFFEPEHWNIPLFVPEAQGQGFAGRIGHIGGGVLDQLAFEFLHDDAEGGGFVE